MAPPPLEWLEPDADAVRVDAADFWRRRSRRLPPPGGKRASGSSASDASGTTRCCTEWGDDGESLRSRAPLYRSAASPTNS